MAQTNDLASLDPTVEQATRGFDFGYLLGSGVTLTGSPTVTLTVINGTDDSPQSRLLNTPQIVSSLVTGAADAAVAFLLGDCVEGVTYRVQCWCNTSDGQVLSLWAHILCDILT